jgi:acyl-CoA reductase-like NAD-dependent aldehyde dehydrogenase
MDFKPGPETARFLAAAHGLLIGGEWSGADSGGRLDSIDPATEERIACCAAAGPADVDAAVAAARCACAEGPWSAMSPTARGE